MSSEAGRERFLRATRRAFKRAGWRVRVSHSPVIDFVASRANVGYRLVACFDSWRGATRIRMSDLARSRETSRTELVCVFRDALPHEIRAELRERGLGAYLFKDISMIGTDAALLDRVPPAAATPPHRPGDGAGPDPDGTTRLVFSDDTIEVFLREGPTELTLVTFSPVGIYANGAHYWGQTVADTLNLRTIGIIARDDSWYPEASMARGLEAVRPLLRGRVLVYGSSMGAYAAIRYSRRLAADTVIAFSPQATISPVDFPDNSYRRFFVPSLHADMRIRPDDLGGRIYLFFDPHYDEDRQHAQLIPHAAGLRRIHVPALRHNTNLVGIGTRAISSLFEGCLSRDERVFKPLIRTAKRNASRAYEGLALHLQERGKPGWARAALARAEAAAPSRDRQVRVHVGWAAIVERRGGRAEAIALLREGIAAIGDAAELWRELGAMQIRAADYAGAADAFAQAVRLGPHNPAVYHGYAHALLMCGRREDAIEAVAGGVKSCPDEVTLRRLHEQLSPLPA